MKTQILQETPKGLESEREAWNRETRENASLRKASERQQAEERYPEIFKKMTGAIENAQQNGEWSARSEIAYPSQDAVLWCKWLNKEPQVLQRGIHCYCSYGRGLRGPHIAATWGWRVWLHSRKLLYSVLGMALVGEGWLWYVKWPLLFP